MTNIERIPAAIAKCPGLSDSELSSATGVRPHRQVNQISNARVQQIDKAGASRRESNWKVSVRTSSWRS